MRHRALDRRDVVGRELDVEGAGASRKAFAMPSPDERHDVPGRHLPHRLIGVRGEHKREPDPDAGAPRPRSNTGLRIDRPPRSVVEGGGMLAPQRARSVPKIRPQAPGLRRIRRTRPQK